MKRKEKLSLMGCERKVMLSQAEVCEYLGIGRTTCSTLMQQNTVTWAVQKGRRIYADKSLLDRWLISQAKD